MMNTLLAVVAVYKNLCSRELVINTANYHVNQARNLGKLTCGT